MMTIQTFKSLIFLNLSLFESIHILLEIYTNAVYQSRLDAERITTKYYIIFSNFVVLIILFNLQTQI